MKTEDKYDDSFKNILTGYRNSKQKFKEKVKSEFQARKSNSKPINIDELKSQYKSIFNSDRQLIARISVINIDFSLGMSKILFYPRKLLVAKMLLYPI